LLLLATITTIPSLLAAVVFGEGFGNPPTDTSLFKDGTQAFIVHDADEHIDT